MYEMYFSDGIGQTGIFIAIDILLQKAERDKNVNIYGCVELMRNDRADMVKTRVSIITRSRQNFLKTQVNYK